MLGLGSTVEIEAREVGERFVADHCTDRIPTDLVHKKDDAGFVKRLGKALARKVGTRFGKEALRIERAQRDSHSGVCVWRLAWDGSEAGTPPGATSAPSADPPVQATLPGMSATPTTGSWT
jgi:hypothetical protein